MTETKPRRHYLINMETPKTFPGILTEEILAKANERAGGLPTNYHNAVYSACLEVLNAHLLKPEIKLELPQMPRRFPGFFS